MAKTYDLRGMTAIVTGGASGIGRAVAETLRDSGASVRVWDLQRTTLAGVQGDVVDVTDDSSIAAALAKLGDEARIEALVNCVGLLGRAGPFADHAPAQWRRLVAVNLVGALQVVQAVLPRMQRQRHGRIVLMGSLAGKEGLAGIAAYSAASAGVIAFTKALAREVAKDQVLVNCVAPGPVDTDMIRGLGEDVVSGMVRDSPLGRLGRPAEVAQLVAWLCSDACTFNTGAVFDMSGGRARY
jgi:3-oxoacyl-[acyl-carrier protein] reductase